MAKRVVFFLTAMLLLVGALAIPVAANQTATTSAVAKLASAYYQQGNLYTFFEMGTGQSPEALKVDLSANGLSAGQGLPLQNLSTKKMDAEYFFLVDSSAYMSGISVEVLNGLAQGLMERSQQNVTISVATLGEKLKVKGNRLSQIEKVRAVVGRLNFTGSEMDLSSGLLETASYLRAQNRTAGTITNVIFVTDGSKHKAEEATLSLLRDFQQNYPDLILHSVSLNAWNTEIKNVLATGTGTHLTVGDGRNAYRAGREITQQTDKLCWLSCPFSLDAAEDLVTLLISLSAENREEAYLLSTQIPNLDAFHAVPLLLEGENPAIIPVQTVPTHPIASEPTVPETQPQTLPVEPASTVPMEIPEETEAGQTVETTEPMQTTGTTEQVLETESEAMPSDTAEQAAVTTVAEEEEPQQGLQKTSSAPVGWYVAGAAAVVVILVLLVLLLKKNKHTMPDGPGIPMQLRVLEGKCKTKNRRLLLQQDLMVGSDSVCDIVFKDKSVAPEHCRIFLKDGMIWLEDLNEQSNTSVDGMKIFAPNRLRSEDEITAGNVRFKLFF